MWAFLMLAFSVAMFGIFTVLNNGFTEKLNNSKIENKAARLMNEHHCVMVGSCVAGYKSDPSFAKRNSDAQFAWVRTLDPYDSRQGYLPELLDKTKNSYLCVTQKKEGVFMTLRAPSGVACEGGVPASIQTEENSALDGVILIYQKK